MFYLTKVLSSGLLSARRERLIRRRGCVIWPGGKPCISLINSAERRTPTKCIFRLRTLVCQCKCCAPTGLTAGSLSVSHPRPGETGRIIIEYDQPGYDLTHPGFSATGECENPKSVVIDFPDRKGIWFLRYVGEVEVRHLNSDDPIQSMSVVVYWPPQLQAVDGLGVDVSAPRCPEDPDDPIPSHRPGPIRIGYPRGRPSPVLGHRRR